MQHHPIQGTHQHIQGAQGHEPVEGTADPTVVVMVDNQLNESFFPKKTVTVLSIVQIILGIISFLAQIIIITLLSTVRSHWSYYLVGFSEGIYCGIFFVIAGILGLLSSHKSTICNITTFMILSILASIFSGIQIINSSIKLDIIEDKYGYTPMVVLLAIILLGISELVVATICAAISCRTCCCTENRIRDERVIYLPKGEYGLRAVPGQINSGFPSQRASGVPFQMGGGFSSAGIPGREPRKMTRDVHAHMDSFDPVLMAGGIPIRGSHGVLSQMDGDVLSINGVSAQMVYLPHSVPSTRGLDQKSNELPSYRDVV